MKVLGIDPGSRHLGYAVVSVAGTKLTTHACGTLHFDEKTPIKERLLEIYLRLKELVVAHKPQQAAIEKVFFAKNALSALKLGQARGVGLLVLAEAGVPVTEYSPNEVKQAIVGQGHADKEMVAKMVSFLTGVKNFESADASDALAIAICHLNTYNFKKRVQKDISC